MRSLIAKHNLPPHGPRARRGAALVEMAIALPVLLILTLGLIEFGWVFLKVSQINMAARHGVRTAVRPDATDAAVTAAVSNMMTSAGISAGNYTMTHTDLGVGVGEAVTVHIAVNYSQVSLTGTGFLVLPNQIQGRGTMAKEGPSTP